MRRMKSIRAVRFLNTIALCILPSSAVAHVSEQGLVLLLPTDIYTGAGVASVAATVVLLAILPSRVTAALFNTVRVPSLNGVGAQRATSFVSFLLLMALILAGFAGPRDPLSNPLPLSVWTVFWIAIVTIQGVFGNLWAWINPWRGPAWLFRKALGVVPAELPVGSWLGLACFMAFAGVLLADPAPSDPDRLAFVVLCYWAVHFAGTIWFGSVWLAKCEGLTLALTALARCGLFGRSEKGTAFGMPGWQIARRRAPVGLALISVLLLGVGSFDGVNETFWWLSRLGINPFEYPGRSALVLPVLLGLFFANIALVIIFALCLWVGLRLIRSDQSLRTVFLAFAPTLLPIALGYHVAHYLTAFMVEGQYALVALSDPLMTGADLLGLGTFYVSTGFFNTTYSVRVIFLTQAGAVVLGHVVAVLVAHAVALRVFDTHRKAILSQLPLALFMIAYTLFGLWLLSSPRL